MDHARSLNVMVTVRPRTPKGESTGTGARAVSAAIPYSIARTNTKDSTEPTTTATSIMTMDEKERTTLGWRGMERLTKEQTRAEDVTAVRLTISGFAINFGTKGNADTAHNASSLTTTMAGTPIVRSRTAIAESRPEKRIERSANRSRVSGEHHVHPMSVRHFIAKKGDSWKDTVNNAYVI